MFSVSHYGFFAFNVDNILFTGLTGNKKVCFLAVTYHCDIYVDAKCNGYRKITSSAYRLVPYNPCFYNAVLSANGRYISGKIKADSLRCQTGSLSFLSAFTSPSQTKRLKKSLVQWTSSNFISSFSAARNCCNNVKC